ncbi:hypothetical protein MMC30_000342 [Trapelia coarctata]|nr:hypothetical protein [Trapelia coarctata]
MPGGRPATVSVGLEHLKTISLFYEDCDGQKHISYQDVIAVLPVTTLQEPQEHDYHTLLYLEKQELSGPETPEPKVVAKIEHIQDPPPSLLERFRVAGVPQHLSVPAGPNDHCNIHVIVSIKSGTCQADSFFGNVVHQTFEALGLSGQQYEVHRTTSERFIGDFTRDILLPRANQGIQQTVLLLSGDGGAVDIINALLRPPMGIGFVKPTIGIVAMGTGNALANSSGLLQDSTKGLRSFLRGKPHNLPTFTAKFSPGSELLTNEGCRSEHLPQEGGYFGVLHGAVVCSWGLHASLVADSDTTEYRKYGSERFQMAAKELLYPSDGSKPHAYKGRVTLFRMNAGGREYPEYLDRSEHTYILATLVSNLEEKFMISPRSKSLDGQLRLVHFGALSSEEILRILGMATSGGGHIREAVVGYQTIEGMRINIQEPDSRWRRICVDGKIVQVGEGGWVEVRKESHNVLDLVIDAPS